MSWLRRVTLTAVVVLVTFVVATAGWLTYLAHRSYDVVAVLGQSNAAGAGDGWAIEDAVPHWGVTRMVTHGVLDGQVIPAAYRPPLPGSSSPVGFDRSFAIEYHDATGHDVMIVNTARGSTGFVPINGYTWDPADTTAPHNLYRDSVNAIRKSLHHGNRLVAVLWHQGESDFGKLTTEQYAALLDSVINDLRAQFPTVPFLVGQPVPEWIEDQGADGAAIDLALRETPQREPLTAYVLGPTGMHNKVGMMHYNAAGQRELGGRYFAAFESLRP